jgi:hypothetical protein
MLSTVFIIIQQVEALYFTKYLKQKVIQLFVVGLMSYLRYVCLLAHSGVQHILCRVFALLFFVLCTLCCFSRLSIFDFHFGIIQRLLKEDSIAILMRYIYSE